MQAFAQAGDLGVGINHTERLAAGLRNQQPAVIRAKVHRSVKRLSSLGTGRAAPAAAGSVFFVSH
jgi:hypothetical protein